MQQFLDRPRLLAAASEGLHEAPVVALLGARQVGKTTLARQVADAWPGSTRILDLEVAAEREALSQTPETVLGDSEGLVVIDEVQRMPVLFEILRPICDDPSRKAVFLLLGSASWSLIKGVSETLAGRVLFVDVAGFSLSEVGADHQRRLWMQGGFPRAWLASSSAAWTRWMQAFTQTFLERDIPGLGSRVSPTAIGRFWRMLAHYHGQVWNASELARSMDASPTAVNGYRDLLAGTFMIRVLPPWFENLGKRLVKSPKIYLRDSGILHFLLGIEEADDLPMHPRYGASWEGFALEQTLVALGSRDAYFYATQRGAELDLMLLRRGRRWGFEFKCTDAPRTTKAMHIAIDDLGLEHLWVVYPGNVRYPITDRITAMPLVEVNETALGWRLVAESEETNPSISQPSVARKVEDGR
ncbi:MAG: ATP-binding protein [Gammaproteobacteria bacterium]|nr:ATP-binding protein [Gammaproteobacteria bacterium]